MAKNIFQKLAVATAGAALSFAAIEGNPVNPAQAATITYDFTVDVTSGPLTGTQGSGFFSYDDATLTGIGLETLGVSEGLSVSFDFLGGTYNETDDADSPDFPIVQFQDGSVLGLNWLVDKYLPLVEFGIADRVLNVQKATIGSRGGDVFAYGSGESGEPFEGLGDVTYQVVPEPDSALGILAFGIGGAGLLLKRKMNRKKPLNDAEKSALDGTQATGRL